MALFKNRAELKKAYGELEDEIYRLKDRIKQQEGATGPRAGDALDARAATRDAGERLSAALVFYQLRALWQLGRELIEQFVTDLARQLEDRERRAHFAEFNRKQFARRQGVEGAAALGRDAGRPMPGAHLASLQSQHAALTRFWHYFKRRSLGASDRIGEVGWSRGAEATLAEARAAFEAMEKGGRAGISGAVARCAQGDQSSRPLPMRKCSACVS